MDRKEKKRLKDEIGRHIDLSNGRFTDDEVSRLYDLVEKRAFYDGHVRTYRSSRKALDSEGTYNVEDTDTYQFCSDDNGIHIKHKHASDWDDGQHDEACEVANTAREILNLLGKLKI